MGASFSDKSAVPHIRFAMVIPAMLVGRIIFPCRSHVAAAGASD
jgi:hypothetical protein